MQKKTWTVTAIARNNTTGWGIPRTLETVTGVSGRNTYKVVKALFAKYPGPDGCYEVVKKKEW